MQVPIEIHFHGVAASPRHEARLRREAARLHRFASGLVSCRVAVERPNRRRRTANPWRVRVEVTMPPGRDLVVSKTSRDDEAPDALLLAVREAFQALERRLKRTAARRRGDVKRHGAARRPGPDPGSGASTRDLTLGPPPPRVARPYPGPDRG